MGRVVWSAEALRHLEGIRDHIVRDRPVAAEDMRTKLKAAGDGLADFPFRGRVVRGSVRELVTVRPYVVRYRVTPETVFILFVRHGARRR